MAVTLNDKYLKGAVNADELKGMEPMVKAAHEMIVNKNGLGNDFLGWVDLPVNYDKEEFERIKKAAAKIKSDSEEVRFTILFARILPRYSVQETASALHILTRLSSL